MFETARQWREDSHFLRAERTVSGMRWLLGAAATFVVLAIAGAQAALGGTGEQKAVLVGFSDAQADELALVASVGGQITHRYKYIPAVAATIPADAAATLASQPGVD